MSADLLIDTGELPPVRRSIRFSQQPLDLWASDHEPASPVLGPYRPDAPPPRPMAPSPALGSHNPFWGDRRGADPADPDAPALAAAAVGHVAQRLSRWFDVLAAGPLTAQDEWAQACDAYCGTAAAAAATAPPAPVAAIASWAWGAPPSTAPAWEGAGDNDHDTGENDGYRESGDEGATGPSAARRSVDAPSRLRPRGARTAPLGFGERSEALDGMGVTTSARARLDRRHDAQARRTGRTHHNGQRRAKVPAGAQRTWWEWVFGTPKVVPSPSHLRYRPVHGGSGRSMSSSTTSARAVPAVYTEVLFDATDDGLSILPAIPQEGEPAEVDAGWDDDQATRNDSASLSHPASSSHAATRRRRAQDRAAGNGTHAEGPNDPYHPKKWRRSATALSFWADLTRGWLTPEVGFVVVLLGTLYMAYFQVDTAVDRSRDAILAKCESIQTAGNGLARFPRTIATGTNKSVISSVNNLITLTRKLMLMAFEILEILIAYVIRRFEKTLLCAVDAVVTGAIGVIVQYAAEITEAANVLVNGLRSTFQAAVSSVNSEINAINAAGIQAASAANVITSLFGHNNKISIPTLSVPNVDHLLDNWQVPMDLEATLSSLRSRVPTLRQLEDRLVDQVTAPLDKIKASVNASIAGLYWNADVMPLPAVAGPWDYCEKDMNLEWLETVRKTLHQTLVYCMYAALAAIGAIVLYNYTVSGWRALKRGYFAGRLARDVAHGRHPTDVVYYQNHPWAAAILRRFDVMPKFRPPSARASAAEGSRQRTARRASPSPPKDQHATTSPSAKATQAAKTLEIHRGGTAARPKTRLRWGKGAKPARSAMSTVAGQTGMSPALQQPRGTHVGLMMPMQDQYGAPLLDMATPEMALVPAVSASDADVAPPANKPSKKATTKSIQPSRSPAQPSSSSALLRPGPAANTANTAKTVRMVRSQAHSHAVDDESDHDEDDAASDAAEEEQTSLLTRMRWLLVYLAYGPAWLLMAMGAAGLSMMYAQYAALQAMRGPLVRTATIGMVTSIRDIDQKIARDIHSSSAQYVDALNKLIVETEDGINGKLLGWVETAARDISAITDKVETEVQNVLSPIFDKAPVVAQVITGWLDCMFGGTIGIIEDILNMIDVNLRIHTIPINNETFALDYAKTQEYMYTMSGVSDADLFGVNATNITLTSDDWQLEANGTGTTAYFYNQTTVVIDDYMAQLERQAWVFGVLLALGSLLIVFAILHTCFWPTAAMRRGIRRFLCCGRPRRHATRRSQEKHPRVAAAAAAAAPAAHGWWPVTKRERPTSPASKRLTMTLPPNMADMSATRASMIKKRLSTAFDFGDPRTRSLMYARLPRDEPRLDEVDEDGLPLQTTQVDLHAASLLESDRATLEEPADGADAALPESSTALLEYDPWAAHNAAMSDAP
ncbi:hypothetical protein CXG81DRAFT_24137 [Caulochytrium protostelioides]|uniref:Plasma membrane fusion protein PRM1 n=1 Tax=Caulochytrium protostelioides TaxID=1555241 RepID=A0A4P9XCU3_9FUNG|nr:hypothetical protein CXG81DRAFT_24137 [Caulochytrium protostelioides]|eukprot:RKP03252.1 hypothetical protein CXG81DRAFT_24137 [Caulochytrium protostelioides]